MGEALEAVGGFEYLTNLASSVPSTHSFETYETLIYDAFRLRDLQSAALAFASSPADEGITDLYQKTIEAQEVGVTTDSNENGCFNRNLHEHGRRKW